MFLDVAGCAVGIPSRNNSFVCCTRAEIVVQRLGIGWCFVELDFWISRGKGG
jgi:hypothetical protein